MLKAQALDVEKIREDFPILKRKVHGKRLVYLDNAATTQKPKPVTEALVEYYGRYNANIHRAVHQLSIEATEAYENARGVVGNLVNAPSQEEVIFTRGTTEAINLVRFGWGEKFIKKGDLIVLTMMEHHSNIVPWQLVAKKNGARIRYVGLQRNGKLRMDEFEDAMRESPSLFAVTQCSNVLGTINDVARLCREAKGAGATTLVDAAQSVPHMPVDFQKIGCDFLAFSVTGDTPVLVSYDNSIQLVPIEQAVELYNRGVMVSVLTLGLDSKAHFEPVKGTVSHLDRTYELRHENCPIPIFATAHHSIYVWRGGKVVEEKVAKLRPGDYVVTLNSQHRDGPTVPTTEIAHRFMHHGNHLSEKVSITKSLMRLIGYYLAEGSMDSNGYRVQLTFSEAETEYVEDARALIHSLEPLHYYVNAFRMAKTIAGLTVMELAATIGVSRKTAKKYSAQVEQRDSEESNETTCHVNYNKRNHTLNLVFNSKKWYEFFKTFCGVRVDKHLPEFAWNVDLELVGELLKGYLRGDASKNERYRLRVKSVSKRLIGELSWLLKLHGISNTVGFSRSAKLAQHNQYSIVIQRSELSTIPEFHHPTTKPDSPRDKLLCVDALREVYRRTSPKYNYQIASTIRNPKKRATREGILKVVEWIRSHSKKPLDEEANKVLDRYIEFVKGDFGLVKVKSVKPAGERLVYDVSVEGTERFFGGYYPILLHNSGHKMLGPTGIGVLCARRQLLEAMDPFQGGGDMIKEVHLDGAKWNELPYKFEAGTSNIADAIGLGAAVGYLEKIGMDRVRMHEVEILEYALDAMNKLHSSKVYGPTKASERGGVISFSFGDIHPHDLASILDEDGVAIRSGHHCAQPLMEWLGVPATCRASFYVYNSYDDVDALVHGLKKAEAIFAS